MFQGNSYLSCKVLRKIEERCAVIDSLAAVPRDAINRFKENLKDENTEMPLSFCILLGK